MKVGISIVIIPPVQHKSPLYKGSASGPWRVFISVNSVPFCLFCSVKSPCEKFMVVFTSSKRDKVQVPVDV